MPENLTAQDHSAPAPPLERAVAAPSASGHPWRRAVLLALLVLVAGAGLGAAGFAAEQHAFVWKPSVSAASNGGWRVTGSAGLRPTAPVIAGGHLVWGQGSYTCVLELDSGATHVVGAAPRGTSIWPPAADERYVAWIEMPRDDAQGDPARLWVYDADRGRRQSFAVGPGAATTAVCGDVVAWYDGAERARVMRLDMRSEDRSVLARGEDVDFPVLAGDGVVGWLQTGSKGSAPSVALRDLETGTVTTVRLAADGSGVRVGDILMAGHTVLWTLQVETTTSILVHDTTSGVSRVIAGGAVEHPVTDGDLVVWATADGSSGSPVIRAHSLADDTEFDAARPADWPSSLALGGGWLAWTSDEGSWTHLEVLRLTR